MPPSSPSASRHPTTASFAASAHAAPVWFAIGLLLLALMQTHAGEGPAWGIEAGVTEVAMRFVDGKEVPGQGPRVRGVFYDGPAKKEVFGFFAEPEGQAPPTGWPGIVLVHGGGGAAFPEWVRMWARRGYVALAMNHLSRTNGGWASFRTEAREGLPRFEGDAFFTKEALTREPEQFWAWNAAQAVVRAGIVLRSHPRVDPKRVALTGISWGGYLTTIVAGIDDRFAVAVPVYGAGFLERASEWTERLRANDPPTIEAWVRRWDPARFAPFGRPPILFLNGRNDRFYYVESHSETALAYGGSHRALSYVPIGHGHGGPGEAPLEILAAVRQYCEGGPAIPRFVQDRIAGGTLTATFVDTGLAQEDFILWTDADPAVPANKRIWKEAPAAFDAANGSVSGSVPKQATWACANLRTAPYDVPGRMWGMDKGEVVQMAAKPLIFSGPIKAIK